MYTFLFMLLNVFGCLCVHAGIDNVEWVDDDYAGLECDACGAMYFAGPVNSIDDAWSELEQYFCDKCGTCSAEGNDDCFFEHHCVLCWDCVSEGDYCELCYWDIGEKICYACCSDFDEKHDHCPICHLHYGDYDDKCSCDASAVIPHCEGCSELQCELCGYCLIIAGEEAPWAESPACLEHAICCFCIFESSEHCRECHSCDYDICPDCGLCEACYEEEEHCPECDECFGLGNKYEQCPSGGYHCVNCCENNDWLCEQCGRCTEGAGIEKCDECGLCEECCMENRENEGCTHGYCILSSDYEDHLCPNCMKCPDDQECEYCLLCEDCQEDYHCEHGLCPDGDDWEEHLCVDCGECFDESELCEYCHKCEGCWEHCEHGICPEDAPADDDEHFTCTQCGECYDGDDRCPTCELCKNCCAANTIVKGCDHGLCILSNEFIDHHWCYIDDQCLELCDHETNDCPHYNVDFEWQYDATAHWQVCIDCGAAVNQQAHFEYYTQIVVDPDPETGKEGKARVMCACDYNMGTVSVPPVAIPTDGSPYIIVQPKDYTGKTNTSANRDPDIYNIYTTFKVRAGGKDLSYQWYYKTWGGYEPVAEQKGLFEGTQTAELKALVFTDACDWNNPDYTGIHCEFFCAVSNPYGRVETEVVQFRAQHVYGDYMRVDDKTHVNHCWGECADENIKGEPMPHRWGEWELIRPATDTQTGLRKQTCLDCKDSKSVVIPKVEPGHEHCFDNRHYTDTQHWYSCICGLYTTPEDHEFGPYHVTKEPTEKQYGERVRYCEICDYEKKEQMDKLPHTHNWYAWDGSIFIISGGKAVIDPEKGGRSNQQHYVYCKSCGQMNAEEHNWAEWTFKRAATSGQSGRIVRACYSCGQEEFKTYPYGAYPVMVRNGIVSKPNARPGETVTIRYDISSSKHEGAPVKFKKWGDEGRYIEGAVIDNIYFKAVNFANANDSVTTFVMPDGPVAIYADWDYCDHVGATLIAGSRMEPSCTGYGHEPDKICALCGTVVEEGARIEPPGHHDLTLIPGTELIAYCTVKVWGDSPDPQPNSLTNGYSGDFLCTRCNKTIKGKKTPLKHGLRYWTGTSYHVDECDNYIYTTENIDHRQEPSCTTWGHTGELICDFCGGLYSKGYRLEPWGHLWGDWELIREPSPAVKGLEQRVCRVWGVNHKETRLTDYSGPHYKLKTERSKVSFEFTLGDTPEPQTITFESKGRNEVTGIKAVSGPSGSRRRAKSGDSFFDVSVDGLSMTFMPNVEAMMADMTTSEKEVLLIGSVLTEEGETTDFTAPKIIVSVKINKLDPNLKMKRAIRNTRPGVPVDAPLVTADVDDLQLQWKSSDNSVAAVDPATGKVTPMQAYGQTTITATYPGNQYYKSGKVSYQLTVISKQGFEGRLWQDVSDAISGVQVKTDGEYQQVRMLPSKAGAGKVDIAFSGFTMPVTDITLPIFTISGVNVTDHEDGTVSYMMSEPVNLTFGEGSNAQTYSALLEGVQTSAYEVPMLKLVLTGNSVTDVIWFGDHFLELDEIINAETGIRNYGQWIKGDGQLYDISGRKLDKVQQPGIYIKKGKKVSVK